MAQDHRIDVDRLLIEDEKEKKNYVCNYCHQVLDQPMQYRCGHRYCKTCIEKLVSKSKTMKSDLICQACKDANEVEEESKITSEPESYGADHTLRKKLEKLNIKCENYRFGCTWKGLIRDYKVHSEECSFVPVACPQCKEKVSGKNLKIHQERECTMREEPCCFCKRITSLSSMADHRKTCLEAPICPWNNAGDLPCPLGCDDNKPSPCYWRTSMVNATQDEVHFDLNPLTDLHSGRLSDDALYSCGQHGTSKTLQSALYAARLMQKKQETCLDPTCDKEVFNIKLKPTVSMACNLGIEDNHKCTWHGSPTEYKDHMKSKHICSFCGTELNSFSEAYDHYEKCSDWETMCLWCSKVMPFNQIQNHQAVDGDCEWRLCPFDCHQVVKRQEIQHHLQNNCSSHLLDLRNRQERITNAATDLSVIGENATAEMSSAVERIQQQLVYQGESLAQLRTNIDHLASGFTSAGSGVANYNQTLVTNIKSLLEVTNKDLKRLTQQTNDVELLRRKVAMLERLLLLKDVAIADLSTRMENIELCSVDGTMLWKVDNVRRRREDSKHTDRATSVFSPTFYSHPRGYKLCLRLYLNGDGNGKGEYVSLFFVLKRSPYDAFLPWPFKRVVTLKLLDPSSHGNHTTVNYKPDSSSSSFERPKAEMNIAAGSPTFIRTSEFDRYIESNLDSIYIYAKVHPPEFPEPNPF